MLYPNEYHKVVLDIDLQNLKNKGIRLILLDLDNTLLEWHKQEARKDILAWLREAEGLGFQLCVVSNNKPPRVGAAAKKLGLPFVCRAKKPLAGGFRRAMQEYGFQPQETCIIGDQIFTDVLGGNRLGLYTILVQPLTNHDFWATKLVTRNLERVVLYGLRKRYKGGRA
ncbi:MAG: YqeG family HAD IIIA-type phosphatase [bacterium]